MPEFRVTPAPTFSATVRVHVPGNDTPTPLRVVMKYRKPAEFIEWGAASAKRPDTEVVPEVVVGWEEADFGVPFSPEALLDVIANWGPLFTGPVATAYAAEPGHARRGN